MSEAERQRQNIEQYRNSPFCNIELLADMIRQREYANTLDPEITEKASKLLKQKI